MSQKSLDDFYSLFGGENRGVKEHEPSESREALEKPKNAVETAGERKIAATDFAPRNLPPSYLVSVGYEGSRGAAYVKLYEPNSQRIHVWYDNTGHKPYLFTNVPPERLQRLERVINHPGFDHFEVIEKYDALRDGKVKVTKVVAKDPLAIGGRPKGCLRDIIPEDYPLIFGNNEAKVWEAAIKYYECYIYDRGLLPGMLYKIEEDELIPYMHEEYERAVKQVVESLTRVKGEPGDLASHIEFWARLLEYPAPKMRRVAIDIEVYSPIATRVPDPEEASQPVICASLVSSDGGKRVLLLKREGIEEGDMGSLKDASIEFYVSERDLLQSVFNALNEYPFVVTFNGDDFDLNYLYHRAKNLGFQRDDVPIEKGQKICSLKYSVHIDLYRFFLNRSIQVYAFAQKYRNVTLDEVARALIGKPKLELSKPVSEVSYAELAKYCLNDAEITLKLTSFDDDLVMKLLMVLTRISRMPMEDVSRQGVSKWIRSFMQYEHRRRNMLIPNSEDIIKARGTTATRAIIKGKKYMGAIVVKPLPGVHFNVAVMDFQSLYPSIIKVYNLGYQTVRCIHDECKGNLIPGTPHWICKKHRSLESALIGSLRDLRVGWYKPKSKDKTLPNEQRNWYNVIQSALKVILNASVDYNENVILRDESGQIHFVRIGEFADKVIESSGSFNDGIHTIAKVSGWEALCFDPETAKIGFAKITHVIRHENIGRKMFEITLYSGRKVRVTPDHSVFILNEGTGKIEPVDATDLHVGDHIVVPLQTANFEGKVNIINLPSELSKLPSNLTSDVAIFIYDKMPMDTRRILFKILKSLANGSVKNMREIMRETGLTRRTASRNIRVLVNRGYVSVIENRRNLRFFQITGSGKRIVQLEEILMKKLMRKKGKNGFYYIWLKDLTDVIDHIDPSIMLSWKIGLFEAGKSKHKIPAILQISEQLARLIGYYVSEGHMRASKSKNNRTSYTITITNCNEKILEDIENCVQKVFCIKPKYTKHRRGVVINSKIVYIFFNNVLSLGVKAEDKKIPPFILSAPRNVKEQFFQAYCLGDGAIRGSGSEIKLKSKSKTLINQLCFLLMQLGIKGISLSENAGTQRLWIRDNSITLGRRAKRKGYAYTVPGRYVKTHIASSLKEALYVYKNDENIDWEKAFLLIKKNAETFGNNEHINNLKVFLEGDLGLDRIKEIKTVKSSSNYVYDLSVEKAENFIGGYGLFCLHNSYGVFGAEVFDLYCPPAAEATSAIGRNIITQTINKARELGIEVIYGDTDSLFLKNPSQEQIRALADWAERALGMDLEADKFYRYAVLSSRKKNYLGVLDDGSVDVKGLTGKKRHIPPFIKRYFDAIEDRLSRVKTPADFEAAKKDIERIIRECYMKLKNREWGDINELAFEVVLGKVPEAYDKTTPQHVKAALMLQAKGVEIRAGDTIRFVKIAREPFVKPVQLATSKEIDVDKYIGYLRTTFDQVLDALNLEFDEIIGLTRLEQFM